MLETERSWKRKEAGNGAFRFLPFFLFLSVPPLYGSSFSSSAQGTTAADFLELGVGARAMGMGGAYTAAADEATALYWNPAALTQVERRSAVFMHAAYLDSSFYDYGAYVQNLGSLGAFGVGFQYLNAGSIAQTDANFNTIGSFTPSDLAFSLGYARTLSGTVLDGFSLGLAAKYVRSAILAVAQTGAVDLGILSPAYLDKKLRLGFTVTNLGGTLRFEQANEPLPLAFKAGSAYRITGRWLASLDVGAPRDNGPYFAAGTEYRLPIKGEWSAAGRLGYNSRTLAGVSGVSGASVGVGFGSRSLNFDYAFVPYGGLGITNRISLEMKF